MDCLARAAVADQPIARLQRAPRPKLSKDFGTAPPAFGRLKEGSRKTQRWAGRARGPSLASTLRRFPAFHPWWIPTPQQSSRPRAIAPAPQGGDVAADVGQQLAIDGVVIGLERLKDEVSALLDTTAVGKLGVLLLSALYVHPPCSLELVPIDLHGRFLLFARASISRP